MKQVIQNFDSGELTVKEVPRPSLLNGGVLVKNHYSCVSAGTERAMIDLAQKSAIGKARERPDLAKKVFRKARNDGLIETYRSVKARLDKPSPLGYSCCGEVVDVSDEVAEFEVGDIVACAGTGYANHAEMVSVPKNLIAPVPDGVASEDAAFVTVGAIALQGIRRAELTPGERVAVVGLGLIGQLVTKILSAYGFPTLAMDIDETQVEKGLDAGATEGAVIGHDDVEQLATEFSNGSGVDAVIIAASTDSDQPVSLAGKIARENGRVSVIGNVGMDIPRSVYYNKELDFNISRSYGPGRYDRRYEEKGLDFPIQYVRWTENRNMREFLRLLAEESLSLESIKTHRFPIEQATDAYDLILGETDESFNGVLLEYDPERHHKQVYRFGSGSRRPKPRDGQISVGLVGAGSFARGTILPALEELDDVSIRWVASATGKSASDVGEKYGCDYATTDYEELLDDEEIDLVVIATRPDTHAEIAAGALRRDKHVHVEKPLAIDRAGLQDVVAAKRDSAGLVNVGYNRRFSGPAKAMKGTFEDVHSPLMMSYRVNAGQTETDHWLHDPEVGGGRVVSELCHFLDLAVYVSDARLERVFATDVESPQDVPLNDNVAVQASLKDGSSASILYTSQGDDSLAKEYVEAFAGGKSATIDNYTTGRLGMSQDKGHEREFERLRDAIQAGDDSPIPFESALETTLATFAVYKSMRQGVPVDVSLEDCLDERQPETVIDDSN